MSLRWVIIWKLGLWSTESLKVSWGTKCIQCRAEERTASKAELSCNQSRAEERNQTATKAEPRNESSFQLKNESTEDGERKHGRWSAVQLKVSFLESLTESCEGGGFAVVLEGFPATILWGKRFTIVPTSAFYQKNLLVRRVLIIIEEWTKSEYLLFELMVRITGEPGKILWTSGKITGRICEDGFLSFLSMEGEIPMPDRFQYSFGMN